MNLLSDSRCKRLLVEAFRNGYEAGHNDTVESQYTDAEERGKDWLADAMEDGTFTGS